jgi:hypothetical protein
VHDRGSLSPCIGKLPAWDIKPTPVFFGPQALFYLLDFAILSKRPSAGIAKPEISGYYSWTYG